MASQEKLIPLPVAILIAAVSAGGGGLGSVATDAIKPPRPDPFTGTMGREMEARLQRQVDRIHAELEQIQLRMWEIHNERD